MKAHLPEYLAEFFGTAIMMIIGIGAVALMWAPGSPMPGLVPSEPLRRLITGTMFAGGATLVVLSRLGQRSGGHLNPAVTLAFWCKGKVKTRDAVWYSIFQTLGALAGVYVVAVAGGEWASGVQLGLTTPGAGYSVTTAFFAEVLITFLLVFLILFCVGSARFAASTPYLAGSLVAFLVFAEAQISGTSLNPSRSLAPAILTGVYAAQWIYWVAPPLGALVAVWLYTRLFDAGAGGCAKLHHTERYRCIFNNCEYMNVSAGEVLFREGEVAERAYVIERGELVVKKRNEKGEETAIATLGPGEWVGELGLLLQLPRSATVVASKDSQLQPVTPDNFAHVIEAHPQETLRLLKQVADRLYRADQRIIL